MVGQVAGEQRLDPPLVKLAPLGLEIRPAVAFAGPGRIPGQRSLIPREAEPAQSLEDDFDRFLRVASGVGVLDPEDELAADMAGKEPVEQGGAGAANMEETRGTGSETDADAHDAAAGDPAGMAMTLPPDGG